MTKITCAARCSCVALFVIAAVQTAAGQAQPVDAFRISGAGSTAASRGFGNRTQDKPAVDPVRERQLEEALKSGQAITDLSLSATVAFRQLNRAEYAVPVTIRIAPASELTIGRGQHSLLDFVGVVTDPTGVIVQQWREEVNLTLGPASIADLAKTPIVYDTAFILLPGRYTLRVVARDQTTDRIGTSDVSFTIPNLERQRAAK